MKRPLSLSLNMRFLIFFSGILFALGLGLSGMTNPAVVQGFFDFTGEWNPQLGLVMGGAVGVTAIAFPLILRRKLSLRAQKFHLSGQNKINFRLIMGSVLFGLGWGAIGICPGPAIVSLVSGGTVLFVIAMFAGIAVHAWFCEKKPPKDTQD